MAPSSSIQNFLGPNNDGLVSPSYAWMFPRNYGVFLTYTFKNSNPHNNMNTIHKQMSQHCTACCKLNTSWNIKVNFVFLTVLFLWLQKSHSGEHRQASAHTRQTHQYSRLDPGTLCYLVPMRANYSLDIKKFCTGWWNKEQVQTRTTF
jgi:hypothetical protein